MANLTALFNVFWKEEFATVPSGWMEGILIPLHKGGGCNRNPETRQKLCGAVRWYHAAVV